MVKRPVFHVLAGLPPSMSPSSHVAEAGGFVFLTGQFGRDLARPEDPLPEGIEAQTERTLGNMRHVLGAMGLGLGDVVSVRVFLTRFRQDYDAMNAVYGRHFGGEARPVRTCVGVTDLVRGALIEIDCVAFGAAAPGSQLWDRPFGT